MILKFKSGACATAMVLWMAASAAQEPGHGPGGGGPGGEQRGGEQQRGPGGPGGGQGGGQHGGEQRGGEQRGGGQGGQPQRGGGDAQGRGDPHGGPDGGQHPQGPSGGQHGGPAAHPGEPHPGPGGYQRVEEPRGWNSRPTNVDRGAYRHNFQAARSYRIGPYRRPPGWVDRRWTYGEVLPRPYWASRYIISDYWLFALEVPPAGFEWIRAGADALLIDTNSGEILQVEYGAFS